MYWDIVFILSLCEVIYAVNIIKASKIKTMIITVRVTVGYVTPINSFHKILLFKHLIILTEKLLNRQSYFVFSQFQ